MQVTIELIQSKIKGENFFHTNKTTVCVLTLENGYEVHGVSSVVDESKFDATIGEKYAKENAVKKVWELEGYLLQQQKYESL